MSSKTSAPLAAKERKRLEALYKHAPFGLLATRHSGLPAPVLLVKERLEIEGERRGKFADRDFQCYGEPMRRLLAEGLLARMVTEVTDTDDVRLGLEHILRPRVLDAAALPLQIPLDEPSGTRLGLLFILQGKMRDKDRIELMARRIARFSREEAAYWYSRVTRLEPDLRSMAARGLKIMLCGDGGLEDRPRVRRALDKLRMA